MRESSLPTEFAELSGYINYIQKKSAYEYSSSCPKCGGSTHPDGELPDRFIMLMPEIAKAKIPFGWCRVCNYKWWPGQKDNKPVDPETIALLQAQAKEAEDKREEERRIKLAEFSTGDLWNELHRRMGEEQRSSAAMDFRSRSREPQTRARPGDRPVRDAVLSPWFGLCRGDALSLDDE